MINNCNVPIGHESLIKDLLFAAVVMYRNEIGCCNRSVIEDEFMGFWLPVWFTKVPTGLGW